MSTKQSRPQSAAQKTYLVIYNAAQAIGWAACLTKLCQEILQNSSPAELYDQAGVYARVFQAASFLEVLHAAVGLVPSSPLMAFLQWAGRSHALFAILHGVPQVQHSFFGPVMLGVWALAEVIRYPWYALTTAGTCPSVLTWLRYTMFIPLYPVGVVCEMALMWLAMPAVQQDGRWSIRLPNSFNWAFEYSTFLQVTLVLYPFIWWQLFSSLLRQRAKKLTKSSTKAE